MSSLLEQMAESSAARVAAARRRLSEAALLEQARARAPAPPLELDGRFDVIAELKRRAPSAGALADREESIEARLDAYADGGAAAVSVLTEPARFDGSLEDLRLAAGQLAPRAVPVMRKDFLVEPYQVIEARAAGAGGVLLIMRMLSAAQARELADCAADLGLWVLAEAFDAAELAAVGRLAESSRARLLVGVNCRDLASLAVVPERLVELAADLPAGLPAVAESGIEKPADAARLVAAGYRLALVGSALMRSADPAVDIRALLAAGRSVEVRPA